MTTPPKAPPPARPPGASRYTWFIGVVAVLLLAWVTINTIGTEGVQSGGPTRNERLIPFATPLAASDLDGDANVASKDDQGDLGRKAACSVRGEKVLNICELYEQGPVVLAIFPSDGARCRTVLDQFVRVGPRLRGVQLAAVGSRGDRDALTARRWPFPVGFDRDGLVASVYGLVGCPQISFAHKGGRVAQTTHRSLSDDELVGIARGL